MPFVSKTSFLKFLQCPKAFYLQMRYPGKRDPLSIDQRIRFSRGHRVGSLVQRLFPGGTNCQPSHARHTKQWLRQTQQAMDSGATVLYEAAFEHDGFIAACDVLVKTGPNCWVAYEVKSSLSIHPTYLHDALFQSWILAHQAFELAEFNLSYVNSGFQLQQRQQYDGFLIHEPLLFKLSEQWQDLALKLQEAKQVMAADIFPKILPGQHCFEPYTCDFMRFCWAKPLAEKWAAVRPLLSTHQYILAEKFPEQYSVQAPLDARPMQAIPYLLWWARPAIPALIGASPFDYIPLVAFDIKHGKTLYRLDYEADMGKNLAALHTLELPLFGNAPEASMQALLKQYASLPNDISQHMRLKADFWADAQQWPTLEDIALLQAQWPDWFAA